MDETKERMLCQCPRGHKLRGSVDLIGEMVRCPRCRQEFVFGYAIRESISDTAVVQILGERPAPTSSDQSRELHAGGACRAQSA